MRLAHDRLALLIEPRVTQPGVAAHETAHSRHHSGSLPAVISLLGENLDHRIDQHSGGHRLGIRITRVGFNTENYHALRYTDLRGSETGAN